MLPAKGRIPGRLEKEIADIVFRSLSRQSSSGVSERRKSISGEVHYL